MPDDVKRRRYDNSQRTARARATRHAVVVAASELFRARGFTNTTVESISEGSGVPIATVYRLFKTKTEILKQVLDEAVAGDDAPVPLGERAIVSDAQAAATPEAMTAAFARVARHVFDTSAVFRLMLREAAAGDVEAAVLHRDAEQQRRVGQARVAKALAEHGFLRPGLREAEARDVVYALMSLDTYRILRLEQRWSAARYERWLADAMHRLLVV